MFDPTLQRERRLRIFKYVAAFFVFAVMVLTLFLNHQHHALERSSSTSSDQISQPKIPLTSSTTTPAPPPPFRIEPLVDSRLDWIAYSRKASEGSILHHHKKGNPSSIYWSVVVVPGNTNNQDQKLNSNSNLKNPWDTPRNGVRMLYLTSVGLTNKIKRQFELSLDDYKSKKSSVAHSLPGSSSSARPSFHTPVVVENALRFARKKIASIFGVSLHSFARYLARPNAMQRDPIEDTKTLIKAFIKQTQAESQKKHADDHANEADEDDEEDEIVKKGDVLGMFIAPFHKLYHDPKKNNAKQQDDDVGLVVYFRNADLTFVEPRGKVLKALMKEMKNRGWFEHADVERQHRSSDGQDDQDEENYSTRKSKKNIRFLFWIHFLIAK